MLSGLRQKRHSFFLIKFLNKKSKEAKIKMNSSQKKKNKNEFLNETKRHIYLYIIYLFLGNKINPIHTYSNKFQFLNKLLYKPKSFIKKEVKSHAPLSYTKQTMMKLTTKVMKLHYQIEEKQARNGRKVRIERNGLKRQHFCLDLGRR